MAKKKRPVARPKPPHKRIKKAKPSGLVINPSDQAREVINSIDGALELRLIVDNEWKELQAVVKALTMAIPAFSALSGSEFVGLPGKVAALSDLMVDLGHTLAVMTDGLAARDKADISFKLTKSLGTVAIKVSEHEKLLVRRVEVEAQLEQRLNALDGLDVAVRNMDIRLTALEDIIVLQGRTIKGLVSVIDDAVVMKPEGTA